MSDSKHVRFKFHLNNSNGIDPKLRKYKTGVGQSKKGENWILELNRKCGQFR